MTKNKESSFLIKALRILSVAPLFYRVAHNAILLVEKEAKEAKKSLVLLIVLFLLLSIVGVTTWICLLGMVFIYLVSIKLSWLLSVFLLFLLNLLLMVILALIILNIKNGSFFPESRRLLFHIKNK